MVAAWIRADTGVGPAMASGSQTNSGSWADLPQAPDEQQQRDGGGGDRRELAGPLEDPTRRSRASPTAAKVRNIADHEAPVTDRGW